VYDSKQLRAVMAGSGRPYDVLTDLRKQLIRALHDGYTPGQIQDMFGLSHETLLAELNPLVEASLVRQDGATFQPNFFVADAHETQRAIEQANVVGKELFEQLNDDWDAISSIYQSLKIARVYSLQDVGLLLIGAVVLDTGLLEYLARDATLLPPAPHRPGPQTPDAHYYFWMIEGGPDAIGKYGQATLQVPYEGWMFFTFGQYVIGQKHNESRILFQDDVSQAAESVSSASQLARQYKFPAFTAADVARWSLIVRNECERLLSVYKANETALRSLYASLKASRTSAYGFAEFFCWFDHVAYAAAIDLLAAANKAIWVRRSLARQTHKIYYPPTTKFQRVAVLG
jgi:hypothetical protein